MYIHSPSAELAAQLQRISSGSPGGINTGHGEKLWVHCPKSLGMNVTQCKLTGEGKLYI
jgi:hypothetical protein